MDLKCLQLNSRERAGGCRHLGSWEDGVIDDLPLGEPSPSSTSTVWRGIPCWQNTQIWSEVEEYTDLEQGGRIML